MLFFLFCSSVFCSEDLQPVTPREQVGQVMRISPPPSPPQLPEKSKLKAAFFALDESDREIILEQIEAIYERAKKCNEKVQDFKRQVVSAADQQLTDLLALCSAQQRQLQQLQPQV